jgi:hypothetical protein
MKKAKKKVQEKFLTALMLAISKEASKRTT